MMDQLGIKALRPGPSGNEKAPNHANYDEALANPFPNLPDPLTHERRPESDNGENVVGYSAAPNSSRCSRSMFMAVFLRTSPK